MTIDSITQIMSDAMYTVVITALPPLLISMVIGLLISIFQTVTSIQEQTLTFLPKLLTILLVLALLGGWMFSRMENYTQGLFEQIPNMG